ncbi:hypothetical protein FA13DRAFT_1732037 [Coprinellus micaceus]|uniref:Uncharacterized protein n=1 Tax=Coprinellus micaceus TaxID=71717 RepID=A0A4Y7TDP9_COPMI|nr:hypothetical protein FA13DRAFT_1732037 [Coprinellus micaceus]
MTPYTSRSAVPFPISLTSSYVDLDAARHVTDDPRALCASALLYYLAVVLVIDSWLSYTSRQSSSVKYEDSDSWKPDRTPFLPYEMSNSITIPNSSTSP